LEYPPSSHQAITITLHFQTSSKDTLLPVSLSCHLASIHQRAMILFIQTLALYKSFTYLLTYIRVNCPVCSAPKADFVFVLDGSSSIGSIDFENVKSFMQSVVEAFDISSEKVRVALIEFSTDAEVQFDLRQYSNKQDVKSAVGGIPYFRGGINQTPVN